MIIINASSVHFVCLINLEMSGAIASISCLLTIPNGYSSKIHARAQMVAVEEN